MSSRRRSSKSLQTIPKPVVPVPSNPMKESSFGSMVKQGFGWGLGNSLAHSAMNTITNTFTSPEVKPESTLKLDSTLLAYKQCMVEFDDKEACKHLLK